MDTTKRLLEELPDAARDQRLNLASVLGDGALTMEQRLGVALACAFAARNAELRDALLADAGAGAGEAWIDDARAAASLMAMNNVYYRTRHMLGKSEYAALPARLRMTRMANPRTSKRDFEMMCLAVSAVNGCETCVRSHEKSLVELGASEAMVHDAVRIAAVVQAVAVGLELDVARAGDV